MYVGMYVMPFALSVQSYTVYHSLPVSPVPCTVAPANVQFVALLGSPRACFSRGGRQQGNGSSSTY